MTTPRNKEELREEFNIFVKKYCGENAPHLLDSDENDGERFRNLISSHLATERTALIEEIVKLSDEVEMSQPDGGLEEWKAFKHFRNKLRDMKSHLESDNHTKQ